MEVTEKIVRKLDKMMKRNAIDSELTLKYLHRLQETDMTLDILTKTGIGIIINKIRKETDSSEVTSLGKQLIKEWKKLVPEKVDGSAPSTGSKRSPDHANGASGDDSGPPERKLARRLDESEPHQFQDVPEAGGRAFFMSKSLDTDDGIRLKAREMIQSALESSPIPSGAFEAEYLAIRIETEIFNLFKSTDPKYKQRVRTRVMNLRDSNNPSLRINVLMGHVKPERLASMTSEPNPQPTASSSTTIAAAAAAATTTTTTTTTTTETDSDIPDLFYPRCTLTLTSHIALVGHLRISRTKTGEPVPGALTYTRRTRLNCPRDPPHSATA
ncbi:Transcription elongation factor A protein 1 [Sparganum proliferum]